MLFQVKAGKLKQKKIFGIEKYPECVYFKAGFKKDFNYETNRLHRTVFHQGHSL